MLFTVLQVFGQGFQEIETRITSLVEERTIPSMVVGIYKDGAIVYQSAFGFSDVEQKVRATPQTSYQLASLSKPITASAIMELHQLGRLDIDGPITDFVKVKKVDETFKDPSIRQVLNHTSGLGTFFDIYYGDEPVPPIDFDTAWDRFGTLFHEPGTINEYSNLGYGLLDHIIAKVSGKPYRDFMEETVFEPLGLDATFVIQEDNYQNGDYARMYGKHLKRLPYIWNNTVGAGNIASNVKDLLKFAATYLENDREKLISVSRFGAMKHRDEEALFHYYQDTHYGLGWYAMEDDQGREVVWHEGGMMGGSTVLKLFPNEKSALVILTNTYAPEVVRSISDAYVQEMIEGYRPTPLNEVAAYRSVASDPSYYGSWKGTVRVEQTTVPVTLTIDEKGVGLDYIDFTAGSFFSDYQPLPYATKLFMGMINQGYFIGTGMGPLPDITGREANNRLLSLKLHRSDENTLRGTLVGIGIAEREYYAYPYFMELVKVD